LYLCPHVTNCVDTALLHKPQQLHYRQWSIE
jgi:hypothetical protein